MGDIKINNQCTASHLHLKKIRHRYTTPKCIHIIPVTPYINMSEDVFQTYNGVFRLRNDKYISRLSDFVIPCFN